MLWRCVKSVINFFSKRYFGYNIYLIGYIQQLQVSEYYLSNKNKKTKTIFITDVSAGLGKATAKLFQEKGWHLIAFMRNPEKEIKLSRPSTIN